MPRARSQLIPPGSSGYYHCIARCVRRAWLCGNDPLSGQCYEHRKAWVEERMLALAELFSVSIYAYAVMSNHLHVVLKVDAVAAMYWSAEEIAERWVRLFPGSEDESVARLRRLQISQDPARVAIYRERLGSLSWFMRCLNEPIARQANAEDGCTGRFWEGRFKSQVLLDERALLAAMAYADLNPIRAGMTTRLQRSEHTGVKRRIEAVCEQPARAHRLLLPLAGIKQEGLGIKTHQYLALVDYTGRQWHREKKGRIPGAVAPILKQLGLQSEQWRDHVHAIGTPKMTVLGPVEALVEKAATLGQRWLCGISLARRLAVGG